MQANPEEELDSLEKQGLLRCLRSLPECGGVICIEGRRVLNFSSNDYLNMAGHPKVKAASIAAIEQYGCGATASRLMAGHLDLHEQVESELAHMAGTETALVFGSGFLANLGVLTALTGRGDLVFSDRLNHASLIDGMRLSGAKWFRYGHKDLDHLERLLEENGVAKGKRVIVSDSVFSMDGDIAPLQGLQDLARKHEALLVVDEAHAFGIKGINGGGVCRSMDLDVKPDITLATMSKALGNYGGVAACSASVREFLINHARSFIYSTGLPPACLGGSLGAMAVMRDEPNLASVLLCHAQLFRCLLVAQGFDLPLLESQILPVYVGKNERALELSQRLWERGIIATAVRPPTVPEGTARLRLSVTLAHSEEDLEQAAKTIAATAREVRVL